MPSRGLVHPRTRVGGGYSFLRFPVLSVGQFLTKKRPFRRYDLPKGQEDAQLTRFSVLLAAQWEIWRHKKGQKCVARLPNQLQNYMFLCAIDIPYTRFG